MLQSRKDLYTRKLKGGGGKELNYYDMSVSTGFHRRFWICCFCYCWLDDTTTSPQAPVSVIVSKHASPDFIIKAGTAVQTHSSLSPGTPSQLPHLPSLIAKRYRNGWTSRRRITRSLRPSQRHRCLFDKQRQGACRQVRAI